MAEIEGCQHGVHGENSLSGQVKKRLHSHLEASGPREAPIPSVGLLPARQTNQNLIGR
jgi:hypothetical protein